MIASTGPEKSLDQLQDGDGGVRLLGLGREEKRGTTQ